MSNIDWHQLTLTELVIFVFVILELVAVLVALVAMVWVRSSTMRRQSLYAAVKNRLIDVISRMQPENERESLQNCLAALTTLARDQQRRLLTELAEYAGGGGDQSDPVFAQLFVAAGLVPEARANAASRPWERLRVIREARALGDPAGLLDKMVRDSVPDVRLGAFEALCNLGRADEALVAIQVVATEGRLNRMRAIDALANARPFPTEQVIGLATSPAPEVRQVCVATLGQARQRSGLDTIITAVTDAETEVRIDALRALAEMKDPSTAQVLINALDDERWQVRSEAAKAAGVLASPAAVQALARVLDDEAEWVRHNAALALMKCGHPGMAALRAAAANGNTWAQSSLAEARLMPSDQGPLGGATAST